MSVTNFSAGGSSSTGIHPTKVTMPALAEMKRQGKPICRSHGLRLRNVAAGG